MFRKARSPALFERRFSMAAEDPFPARQESTVR